MTLIPFPLPTSASVGDDVAKAILSAAEHIARAGQLLAASSVSEQLQLMAVTRLAVANENLSKALETYQRGCRDGSSDL